MRSISTNIIKQQKMLSTKLRNCHDEHERIKIERECLLLTRYMVCTSKNRSKRIENSS